MNKKPPSDTPLPSKEDIAALLQDAPAPLNKREIARAFGLDGQARTQLRRLLRDMAEDGMLKKTDSKTYTTPDALEDTALVTILGLDGDGEIVAKPAQWTGKGRPPKIYITGPRATARDVPEGETVMARLRRIDRHSYEARILKGPDVEESQIVGIFKSVKKSGTGGGVVYPTDKKIKFDLALDARAAKDLENGDLVLVAPLNQRGTRGAGSGGGRPARLLQKLGAATDPRLISLIAIHSHSIPDVFPEKVLAEAEKLRPPALEKGREDLRALPLVTIDGADARDFDDAVFAEPDTDPKNAGGWKIVVAIADVSYYVRAGTALGAEAYRRGNSTYFADRVVPMLPERLSNDLCSLRPLVDRACLAAFLWIDKDARLIRHRFCRGLMKSAARLTYEQVEAAHKGAPDDLTGPLMERVIAPLYKAYGILKHAREKRGALDIDLPERRALIDDKGVLTAIVPRAKLASHQLIEEFMILANVAAAEALEAKNAPCLYRVHDRPSAERLETTRDFLKDMGYSLPRSDALHARNINRILHLSADRPDKTLIHTILLRTQSQAVYDPDNIGHFGLALTKYAHFTSPIRRYADLVVHRSLVRAFGLGDGGLTEAEAQDLSKTAEHITATERRSMLAERDVMDRFTAQYLSQSIGGVFKACISSVTRFGLFVTLDETGADGIVPMRSLPRDYYVHDEKHHCLVGRDTGRRFRLSDPVVVRLLEADPMTGSTVFELAEGADESKPPEGRPQKRPHRRPYKTHRPKTAKSGPEKSAPEKSEGGHKNGGGKKRRFQGKKRK